MQHVRIIFINSNRVLLSRHSFCSTQLKKVSIAQYRSFKFLYQDQVRLKVYGVGVNDVRCALKRVVDLRILGQKLDEENFINSAGPSKVRCSE